MTGWASLLGALGLVAIVFGLASFVLWLFVADRFVVDTAWIYGNFGVGVALLVSAAVLNLDALRERMRSGEARRASKFGTSAIASTVFAIAILGLLGFLTARHPCGWTGPRRSCTPSRTRASRS